MSAKNPNKTEKKATWEEKLDKLWQTNSEEIKEKINLKDEIEKVKALLEKGVLK